jgi:DNA-binding MarR family transcriptional regulator
MLRNFVLSFTFRVATPESLAAFTEAIMLTGSTFRCYLRQRFKECSLDLTTEMMQVLRYLWRHDCVNQQEIANAVNRDKASLTAMLDNLVRRELVTRCEDSHDRRSKRIVLTTKGRALEQAVTPLIREMYELAGQHIPSQQLEASMALLSQLNQNLALAGK